MIRIQCQSLLEAPSGPGVFLPGEMGVGSSDVQFDGVGVQRYAFIEDSQGFIVAAFVIEMMGLFVEIVGAEECVRHRQDLSRRVNDKLRNCRNRSKRIPHAGTTDGIGFRCVIAVTLQGVSGWYLILVSTDRSPRFSR